jgi:biotin carboxyl carrier protein
MEYHIKIDDQTYVVEIEDMRARPIVALVDGVPIQVWLEEPEKATLPNPSKTTQTDKPSLAKPAPIPSTGHIPSGAVLNVKEVRAPIPGVIISVLVKPGDAVEYGQELFLIEAMKMRNSIRSSRSGVVAEILVAQGQTVNHNEVLLRFSE